MFDSSPQHKTLLTHPVLASFLEVKWLAIKWTLTFYLTAYSIFSLLFTTYTFLSFGGMTLFMSSVSNQTKTNDSSVYEFNNAPKAWIYPMSIALMLITTFLILWEVLQMLRNIRSYLRDVENYMQIFLIVSTMAMVITQWTDSEGEFNSSEGLRHLASLCIVVTWGLIQIAAKQFAPPRLPGGRALQLGGPGAQRDVQRQAL